MVRFKGTILIGVLESDIKQGQSIKVGDQPARIWAIETFGKLHETASAGQEVAIMVRNIAELPVEAGWEVTNHFNPPEN